MLGFMRPRFDALVKDVRPGAIVITGPTGSGKTTTIYAMLNQIDTERKAVYSVEKPIESNLC